MKQKIVKVVTIIGILSLLPLFMGQEDCENSETLKQLEVYNQLIVGQDGMDMIDVTKSI